LKLTSNGRSSVQQPGTQPPSHCPTHTSGATEAGWRLGGLSCGRSDWLVGFGSEPLLAPVTPTWQSSKLTMDGPLVQHPDTQPPSHCPPHTKGAALCCRGRLEVERLELWSIRWLFLTPSLEPTNVSNSSLCWLFLCCTALLSLSVS
jgi:hypothetical protein